MRRLFLALSIIGSLGAQAPAPVADPLASLRFLEGDWKGEGDGRPGQSLGTASFRFEVDGKVLVRRNLAVSAPGSGQPGFHHEDLMTVFVEGGALKGLYVDNEGHVIRYLVSGSPEGACFLSEPGDGPSYRMTYLRGRDERVTLRFEVAPTLKPVTFRTYIEATLFKVK